MWNRGIPPALDRASALRTLLSITLALHSPRRGGRGASPLDSQSGGRRFPTVPRGKMPPAASSVLDPGREDAGGVVTIRRLGAATTHRRTDASGQTGRTAS